VLGASNDTSILNTLDGLGHHHTSQNGIRRETLPDTTTVGTSAQRPSDRAQLNVHTLITVLLTHSEAALVGKSLVPGSGDIDTRGET
jgi:hypothetical protein